MKSSLLILIFTLLLPMPASARIYKWFDDSGMFHAVDDLHKVPQKDRHRLGLDLDALKEEIRAPGKSIIKHPPKTTKTPAKSFNRTKQKKPEDEIFGGKTLRWWAQTLTRIKREKSELENAIISKKEYTGVFEGGRRLGTIYNQDSIDRYERYLEELPEDNEKLVKKEDYLNKLLRRAKNAGVPRNVREN